MIPAAVAPASPLVPPVAASVLPDAANTPKFYTITASLREEYDDNIYTTRDNKVGSLLTEFSPSILVNLPMQDSAFSARYTFGVDYYLDRASTTDFTNEALVHYTHRFSNRFSLDLSDQIGYYTQPDLLDAVGSPFVNGGYFANSASASFTAQWTPLLGTATTYSNIAVLYSDSTIAQFQNSDENTLAHDFRFAIYPKINLTAGGIFDQLAYFDTDRGYTDYTGDVGVDWQALPNVSIGVRGGFTITTSPYVPSSVSPYAAVTLDWQLGKRSDLNFSYVHNVVPTDEVDAIGSEADRFSARFSYQITPRLTASFDAIETLATYDSNLIVGDQIPAYSENEFAVDLGLNYNLNSYLSLETGYLLSGISSELDYRDYSRNQVYVGVRGTY